MSEIKFGTDGWRAILNKDFNIENTLKVTNAIAIYIYNTTKFDKKIIIGYDPRNKADEFAEFIAKTLSDFGFNVEMSDKIIATPVLAYNATIKNAYAIMLTASHNPSEYLGIKFIPPYGGPAEDSTVQIITENIENKFENKIEAKEYKKVSFEKDYINHIKNIINFEKIKASGIKINYDAHHGAAGKLFKEILDSYKIKNNSTNLERDINFGGFMPDPKEKYLPKLKQTCKETGNIGLSNDGDGDRFGVFDENGVFISPNDIIGMLFNHLVKNKSYKGKLAKTVGASYMLDLLAKKKNVEIIETPVGFKWLGSAMRHNDVIIAGEESGGLSIKGHIPEKDGIIANLLIMELIAYEGKKLCELHLDFLNEFNRKFINERIDIKLESKETQDKIINKFKNIEKISEYKVVRTSSLDGLKLYFEDTDTILIRKSGTEPLLRIYIESDKEEKINLFKSFIQNFIKQ